MKIMITGSMTFSKEMIELQEKLNILGHDATVPIGIDSNLSDPTFQDDLARSTPELIENDIMMQNFKQIEKQDAIIVLNKKKNEIEGYIGISALMEIGIAHFLGKKVFVLYDIPHFTKHRWAHEVTLIKPVLLHGDLQNIKE